MRVSIAAFVAGRYIIHHQIQIMYQTDLLTVAIEGFFIIGNLQLAIGCNMPILKAVFLR